MRPQCYCQQGEQKRNHLVEVQNERNKSNVRSQLRKLMKELIQVHSKFILLVMLHLVNIRLKEKLMVKKHIYKRLQFLMKQLVNLNNE